MRRTHGVLSAKKVAIQLLNVTPVLVEKCLGRLPGHIAEVASSCAQKWLKEGRRLVVYDESATVRRVLEQRREELAVAYERGRA